MNGNISFSNVCFKHPATGNLILNNISFTIKQGEFIAFVGRSGAGKSSIFRLLSGLEMQDSGEIRIGCHQNFSAILQTTQLLPGTISSNISHDQLTTDEIWKLVRCVGLEQDILAMPMKLNTYISDNASESISGGQRQKILLARALAAKPQVLLLDEATSAMDNESQQHIHNYLQTLNITRIVIAHRMSTIVNADRIYVMDKGEIVACGTYPQLLQKGLLVSDIKINSDPDCHAG